MLSQLMDELRALGVHAVTMSELLEELLVQIDEQLEVNEVTTAMRERVATLEEKARGMRDRCEEIRKTVDETRSQARKLLLFR